MTGLTVVSPFADDVVLVKLAREIAINHHPLEEILKRHEISARRWEVIQQDKNFLSLLAAEVAAWESATNTHERTKLKAAALVEEWLPEANIRIHDGEEALSSKVELAKLLARIAQMGLTDASLRGATGEKFVVNINLGGDAKLTFEKQLPPKIIDAEAIESS